MPDAAKREAALNMQWLAVRGGGYTALLSDTLKYLNDGWWRKAYRSALSAAVAAVANVGGPGEETEVEVLDLGSGTGTLAVWAAQAGATSVFSCERERWAYLMATATVGLSGVAHAVKVAHQHQGCEAVSHVRRPRVLVHDILGTPARMGSSSVLHDTQRQLDTILQGPWRAGGGGAARAGDAPHAVTVPAAVRVYLQVAHSPVGGSYVSVPSTIMGHNVSSWRALAVPEANKLEHTASQVPRWPLTQRRLVTHWDFMDPPYRDAKSSQGPPHALRMEETWEQDLDLPVVQAGLAHMVVISRELEFVGGAVYSDTTSWVDVEQAREAEGLSGVFGRHGGEGQESERVEDREERAGAVPEVGQLMFVGPGVRVERGGSVRVRVTYGAQGFHAALLA